MNTGMLIVTARINIVNNIIEIDHVAHLKMADTRALVLDVQRVRLVYESCRSLQVEVKKKAGIALHAIFHL